MPRFKSIIFYQYSPKIKLVVKKKCKIFKRWGNGVARDGGNRGRVSWCHPFFCPKIDEDRKTKTKKGHCRQISEFSAQKCKVQNKKKKRSLPLIWLVFVSSVTHANPYILQKGYLALQVKLPFASARFFTFFLFSCKKYCCVFVI